MTKSPKNSRTHFATTTTLAVTLIAAPACSDSEPKKPALPIKTWSPAPSAPEPTYKAEQIKAALISPKEVGGDVQEVQVALESMARSRAPMCSLTDAKIANNPKIAARQFQNPQNGKGEIKYAQLFALFKSSTEAASTYKELLDKARSCPAKQHVDARKIKKNFILLSHNDSWRVTETPVAGWTHFRGVEEHVEPPSETKYNVYHFMYDYARRGNVIISTLYWEPTEPKGSADPIIKRADEVLSKQLQKIG